MSGLKRLIQEIHRRPSEDSGEGLTAFVGDEVTPSWTTGHFRAGVTRSIALRTP